MIRRVWLRLAVLLAIASLPVLLLQLKLQRDSLNLVFDLADRTGARGTIDSYLDFLRTEARRDPERAAELRTRFQSVELTKRALEEFALAREPLRVDLWWQTVGIALLVLLLSLAIAARVARAIVRQLRTLIAEREAAAVKLRELASLERWQMVARTLVHELRAPLTPLKLIATDMEQKHAALPAAEFASYLAQAQSLVREQLGAIEAMVASFTTFGRLPPATRAPVRFSEFIAGFAANYGQSFELRGSSGSRVVITAQAAVAADDVVALDAKLMVDLLFNICKNAVEANPDQDLAIAIEGRLGPQYARITVRNNGRAVPGDLAARLFEPYVSGHATASNMGLGLATARKIALEHDGDLRLADNVSGNVCFCCEFPRAVSPRADLSQELL